MAAINAILDDSTPDERAETYKAIFIGIISSMCMIEYTECLTISS